MTALQLGSRRAGVHNDPGAMDTHTWTTTTDEGDDITVAVDPAGVGVSVRRVWGGTEGGTCALEDFDREFGTWVVERFAPDVVEAIRAAVDVAGALADHTDDEIP